LQWDIIMKHCPGGGADCHDHPLQSLVGANQQFTVPDHGDGTRFEIRLTATDNRGLTSVATREITPKTLQITLAANPNVGTVSYDTIAHTPPFTTTTIAGSKHKIGAQPPGGQLFGGWAHGGLQEQDVTVGEQNVTYTANMGGACAPRPRVTVATTPAGANARQVTVSASTNAGNPANLIQSIQFTELRGATVEAAGTPATATPPTLTYAGGAAQATFIARRSQSVPIMVRFTVTDACGAWTTFVGSGSATGF
jgi:hypothetical protein